MKHKITLISVVLLLSLIFLFVSKSLNGDSLWVCQGDFLCQSFWFRGVLWPLHESLLYIIFATTFLVFLPLFFLKIWLKIIVPYFFIALIITISTPELCGGMICFDRTLVATGFGKIFLALTVFIIIGKSIHLFILSRKNKTFKN